MKKILLFMLVAMVLVALVACGGNDTTTPATTTAGDNTQTTTTPADGGDETTPAQTEDTTIPEDTTEDLPGYDLVNELYVIDEWSNMVFFTFEDSHGDLDFHPAVVFKMNNVDGVYSELFYTPQNDDGSWNTNDWELNDEFTWFFYVDDKKIEVTRFSLFNNGDWGYVRADLGADFSFDDFEYDENGVHYYTVKFEIYDSTNELCYYGDLTSYGEMEHKKPAKIESMEDPTKPAGSERVPASVVTGVSGPNRGKGEGFEKLFDNDVRSKLCTGDSGTNNAIVINFSTAQNISGISLFNANDNEAFNDRTVLAFDIYLSTDGGQTWDETPAVSIDKTLDADGNAVDRGALSTNYAERYYDFGKTLEGVTDIKIVINHSGTYQISELVFWLG